MAMNWPPWAYGTQASPQAQAKRPLPNVPWRQYATGQMAMLPPYRPTGLGVVPSIQQWGRFTPSEQAGYGGFVSDELGLWPEDVGWLMKKLAPQGYRQMPRWAVR